MARAPFGTRAASPPLRLRVVRARTLLAAGALVAALAGGGAALLNALAFGSRDETAEERTVAFPHLGIAVPAGWIAPTGRGERSAAAAPLAFSWPGLHPLRADAAADGALALVRIDVARAAADDPAEEAARRHARFVTHEAETGPDGLVARRFADGSPYEGQILLSAAHAAAEDEEDAGAGSFEARCPDLAAGGPEPCVSRWRQGALDVALRFPPEALAGWRALLADARERVSALAPRGR